MNFVLINMEPLPVSEVLEKTLFPLLKTYLPVFITLLLAWITLSQFYFKTTGENEKQKGGNGTTQKNDKKPTTIPVVPKVGKKKHAEKHRDLKQAFNHEWLLTSLKGHTGAILDMDFSTNGKYIATCSDDRAIFIWSTKDWKERDHKFIRYNVDYDHASLIKWSPDSKAFVYNRTSDNAIEVCKLVRKPDGWISSLSKALTFPKVHKEETIGLGISVSGRFIMTASAGTELCLWDLKGTELTRLDTYLMNNIAAKVSPCGTFIAASGFAPDVKLWEVSFSKSGEFKQVTRAFELTGHGSGVTDFDFSADSSQVVTVSKDGSWRLYNIKIEYTKGEEPHLINSGKYKYDSSSKPCIAIAPDGQVIALGCGPNLIIINAISGEIDKTIFNVYPGAIRKVLFDAAGAYILTAGDKHVRIFHNVTGHKTRLHSAKTKLNQSGNSQATKERLQKTIETSEAFLANFSE